MSRLPIAIPFVVLLSSCSLLSGCASVPETSPPELEAEIPGTWAALGPDAEADSTGSTDRWWELLRDSELDTLIQEALAHNGDLAAAAARIDQAVAQARIAGAEVWPQIDASGSGSRRRQNFIGFPIPGSDQQVLSSTSTSVGVQLNVSWEADLWGRLRAREAAALADIEARRADWAAARLSLAGQVTKGWLALREAQAQAILAERTLENRRRTEERIRRRYEAGLRSPLDLRLALSNRASAEALLAQRRQQLDAARRQIEILAGQYPLGRAGGSDGSTGDDTPGDDTPGGTISGGNAGDRLPEISTPPPGGLPSELLLRRPDLAAAERRLAVAGARVHEARRSLYPRLSLTGSVGQVSEDLEDLLDSDFSVWSLLGHVLQPIFQGGRLRAAVELSEAQQRELAAGYVQSALRALGEVEVALASEGWLDDRVTALTEAVTQALAARDLAEDRYAAGLADYLAVLESQRQALLAQSELLSARRQRLEARVDLHLALGGGFEASQGSSPEFDPPTSDTATAGE